MEAFSGTKFRTVFVKEEIPQDDRIQNIIDWCKFFQKHSTPSPYAGGSFGNLSVRSADNQFIITASAIGNREIKIDDFVEVINCDLENNTIYVKGVKEPSSESFVHYLIYLNRRAVCAIIHSHNNAVLNAAKRLNLPETRKKISYGTLELAREVAKLLASRANFIVIKNHGFVSVGMNIDEAGKRAKQVYIQIGIPARN